MPLVHVTVVEGALSAWQKRQMVEGVTEVLAALLGEDIRTTTDVIVDEIGSGDSGGGGRILGAADANTTAAATAGGEETP